MKVEVAGCLAILGSGQNHLLGFVETTLAAARCDFLDGPSDPVVNNGDNLGRKRLREVENGAGQGNTPT